MTKLELSKRIADITGLDVEETLRTIEVFQKVVIEATKEGEIVYMRGFGCFENVKQKARKGINLGGDKSVLIVPEKNKPKFTPYNNFKLQLNK